MDEPWAVTDIEFGLFQKAQGDISRDLRVALAKVAVGRGPYAAVAQRLLADDGQFRCVVDALATAAVLYAAGFSQAEFDPDGPPYLRKAKPRRGRPFRPEVQALLFDVRETLSEVFGPNLGLWQYDSGNEGVVTTVARLAASSVSRPLGDHLRVQISKARRTTKTFM